jgi:hypothetical protein
MGLINYFPNYRRVLPAAREKTRYVTGAQNIVQNRSRRNADFRMASAKITITFPLSKKKKKK